MLPCSPRASYSISSTIQHARYQHFFGIVFFFSRAEKIYGHHIWNVFYVKAYQHHHHSPHTISPRTERRFFCGLANLLGSCGNVEKKNIRKAIMHTNSYCLKECDGFFLRVDGWMAVMVNNLWPTVFYSYSIRYIQRTKWYAVTYMKCLCRPEINYTSV